MLDAALREFVLADPTVAGLIGTAFSPNMARPGHPLPYVTHDQVSSNEVYHTAGRSLLETVRLQIDVWAASPTARDAIKDALVSRIAGTRGTIGSAPPVFVHQIRIETVRRTYEEPNDAGEQGTFRASIDAMITHAV